MVLVEVGMWNKAKCCHFCYLLGPELSTAKLHFGRGIKMFGEPHLQQPQRGKCFCMGLHKVCDRAGSLVSHLSLVCSLGWLQRRREEDNAVWTCNADKGVQ